MGIEGGGQHSSARPSKWWLGCGRTFTHVGFLLFFPFWGFGEPQAFRSLLRGTFESECRFGWNQKVWRGQEAPGLSFSEERVHTDVYDVL